MISRDRKRETHGNSGQFPLETGNESAAFSPALRNNARPEMEAVIFVGIQGSGKSSFFRQRFSATHAHINLDTLKTRPREQAAIISCVAEGKPFVVDNTNPSPENRKKYIEAAKAAGLKVVCYYFDVPLKEALERNEARTGKAKVPKIAILTTHKRLAAPTFSEGFNEIYRVTVDEAGGFAVAALSPA